MIRLVAALSISLPYRNRSGARMSLAEGHRCRDQNRLECCNLHIPVGAGGGYSEYSSWESEDRFPSNSPVILTLKRLYLLPKFSPCLAPAKRISTSLHFLPQLFKTQILHAFIFCLPSSLSKLQASHFSHPHLFNTLGPSKGMHFLSRLKVPTFSI